VWWPGPCAPPDLQDTILRRALESDQISHWYRLYLLSWLWTPLPSDKELAGAIWNGAAAGTQEDEDKRLLVVDLLLRWGDTETLVTLLASCRPGPVRTEIIWGLAQVMHPPQVKHPQVATYLESEIRDVWAPAFSKGTSTGQGITGRAGRALCGWRGPLTWVRLRNTWNGRQRRCGRLWRRSGGECAWMSSWMSICGYACSAERRVRRLGQTAAAEPGPRTPGARPV